MDIREVSESLSVSDQIYPEDLPGIAEAGFQSIICNRPDGEAEGQPSIADIEQAAKAEGLSCRYVPVIVGQIGEFEVTSFARELAVLPGPTLAFCRTGNRSMSLWSMITANGEETSAGS